MANLFSSAAIAALGHDIEHAGVSIETLCRCAIHSAGHDGLTILEIKTWIDA